ncbi:MAG: hypothetical protein LBG80_00220 [Bacteroidales bacterium]|jgi:hypothetical protein|nr:hypothetical protein [Bacteroidales bacterium]
MIKNTLIKSLLPTVKRYIDNGMIDKELQEFKKNFESHIQDVNETVVIVNTTEILQNGNQKEFLNVCIMDIDRRLRLINQFQLSEIIELILKTK